mmetsp:Transcript_32069/g.93132  ORF Transcript_32069/g.93132 Transcript_32069/m.93132 type:complete len:400 (-) Transcript_32069:196-1395(-)
MKPLVTVEFPSSRAAGNDRTPLLRVGATNGSHDGARGRSSGGSAWSAASLLGPVSLVLLCALTSVERVSFKMLVDEAEDYIFAVVLCLVLCETAFLALWLSVRDCGQPRRRSPGARFPISKLLVMAALDLAKDFAMTIPGAYVAPTLTVMLLQGQTPVSLVLRLVSSGRSGFRTSHFAGAAVIAASVLVALLPALVSGSFRTVLNTLLYLSSCVPAAASALYKEQALVAFRQPVDPYELNLQVDLCQLLLLIPATPAVFRLTNPGSSDFVHSLQAAFRCIFSASEFGASDDSLHLPDTSSCNASLYIMLVYIVAALLVNWVVDKVFSFGSSVMLYRAVTAATLTAFIVLGFFAHGHPHSVFGVSVAVLNIPSAIILVVGSEIYHRYMEPGSEALTQWSN